MTSRSEQLRIGGDIEVDPIALSGKKIGKYLGFSSPYTLWLDTARSALLIAAYVIQNQGGNGRIWLPAYGCKSISQAFRQAGFDLVYYAVGSTLQNNQVMLPRPEKGDTLLFIHYFGHCNKTMLDRMEYFRKHDVRVIEDYVQSGLRYSPVLHGDFAVTSFRKLLSVPDGAILASREQVIGRILPMRIEQPDEAFISAKLMGKMIRGCHGSSDVSLSLLEEAEKRLNQNIIPRYTSSITKWMLSRVDCQAISGARRENWFVLSATLERAQVQKWINPLFSELGIKEVPLGFPVIVSDGKRDALRRFLIDRNIFCPVHWPLDYLPENHKFNEEVLLSTSLLTLPVDQRMTTLHIDYMVNSIKKYISETK